MAATGHRATPNGNVNPRTKVSHDTTPSTPTLRDLGITRDQSSDWQRLAAIPEEQFERAMCHARPRPSRAMRGSQRTNHCINWPTASRPARFAAAVNCSSIFNRPGGRPAKTSNGTVVSSQKAAANAAGLSQRQRETAVRVANVPEEDFERQVESAKPPIITIPPKHHVSVRHAVSFKTRGRRSAWPLSRRAELSPHAVPGALPRLRCGPAPASGWRPGSRPRASVASCNTSAEPTRPT